MMAAAASAPRPRCGRRAGAPGRQVGPPSRTSSSSRRSRRHRPGDGRHVDRAERRPARRRRRRRLPWRCEEETDMKQGITPTIRCERALLVRQHVPDPLHRQRDPGRAVLELPSLLHGEASSSTRAARSSGSSKRYTRRHRRPSRPSRASRSVAEATQAPTTSVAAHPSLRRPGGRRGRHDAWGLGSGRSPSASLTPRWPRRGRTRSIRSCSTCRSSRSRSCAGIVLGQSLAIGMRDADDLRESVA